MAPGKRPITSMAPTIVFDAAGEPVVAGGSAGGGPIVDYVASGLIDMLAAGRTPAQAVARGHLSTAIAGKVRLEAGTEAERLAPALRRKGHTVDAARMSSGMGFIQRRDGGWTGAADPRRDGVAASSIIR
jgi:gamma-glutamyltranspeptidase/glutathione hydrolase